MKKLFVLLFTLLVVASSFANSPHNIDEKLLRTFSSSFPHAERVSWQELSNTYVVSFIENGIRSRIVYQKDGQIVNVIRYYFEESLPVDVRLAAKRSFPANSIKGVVEVSALADSGDHLDTAYYLKMETEHNWMTVKIDSEGNTSVVEKFRKAM